MPSILPFSEQAVDYRLDTDAIAPLVDALDRRRWLFANLPTDPIHLEWFRHRAWVRTVHGTTKIEGNTLSDIEVEDLLGGRTPRVSRREALEILGSREAISFVDDIAARAEVPVDEAVVRETHRRALADIDALLTPGEYRRGENRVIDASGQTIFTTPPPGDVPQLMRAFGLWLRDGTDDLPAPVAAAVAHLEFVAIHPFNDGNGRIARALARLMLTRGDLGFGGLVSLDGQLDHERNTYFSAIAATTGGRYEPGYDATPFVTYFVSATVRAADHTLARMRGLGQVLLAVRRPIITGELPAPMLDGLAYAWINNSMRPADYARITGRTAAAATRDLGLAARLGYLVPRGATRTRRYVVGPALAAISSVQEA
jgi:Fic family protein